jgi:hypothetical protein
VGDVVRDIHRALLAGEGGGEGAGGEEDEEDEEKADDAGYATSLAELEEAYRALGQAPRRPVVLLMDPQALGWGLLDALLRCLADLSAAVQAPVRVVAIVSTAGTFGEALGPAAVEALRPAHFVLPPVRAVFEKVGWYQGSVVDPKTPLTMCARWCVSSWAMQLLERLFVRAELPVMVSGRVLRFMRVMFVESHGSIRTFFK